MSQNAFEILIAIVIAIPFFGWLIHDLYSSYIEIYCKKICPRKFPELGQLTDHLSDVRDEYWDIYRKREKLREIIKDLHSDCFYCGDTPEALAALEDNRAIFHAMSKRLESVRTDLRDTKEEIRQFCHDHNVKHVAEYWSIE